MDEELQQLEAELKQLRPAPPSRELRARINRELSAAEATKVAAQPANNVVRRSSRAWWIAASALPIAAAIALVFTLNSRRGETVPVAAPVAAGTVEAENAVFKPVAAENVLYSARDEGLVTLDDGTPARRERLRYVDTITWKDPRSNASVRWTVPREEVRVVPVRFQ